MFDIVLSYSEVCELIAFLGRFVRVDTAKKYDRVVAKRLCETLIDAINRAQKGYENRIHTDNGTYSDSP